MIFPTLFPFLLGLVWFAQPVIGLVDSQKNLVDHHELDFNTNLTDAQVIRLLAASGYCQYYPDIRGSYNPMDDILSSSEELSLAACDIWCPDKYGDQSGGWNCTFDWESTAHSALAKFYDEDFYQFMVGSCTCFNITEPVTINSTFFANPNKAVQDLTAWGYRFTSNDFQDPNHPQPQWHLWEFQLPGLSPRPRIGVFGVDRNGLNPGTLVISETWASRDRRQNRAYLSDQTLSFWKLTPLQRNLNDLNTLYYYSVMEMSLNQLQPVIYQKMGASMGADLLVRKYTTWNNESEAFNLLLNGCKFCKAAQRLIDEYAEFSHREIVGFRFSLAGLIFEIFYDGAYF